MSNNRDLGDVFAEWMGAVAAGCLLGLIFGYWQKKQQEKQMEERRLRWPDVLEVNHDGPIYIPPSQRPWYVRHWDKIWHAGAYFVFVFGLCGFASLVDDSAAGCLGSVMSFLAAAGIGYGVMQLRDKQQSFDIQPALPTPEPVRLSQAHSYTVTLPSSVPWQPQTAGRFMEHILHKVGRLTFQIVANDSSVSWRILDLRRDLDPAVIREAVQAFYPEAQVEVNELLQEAFNVPFYCYVMAFEPIADPLLPITYVDALKQVDPLVNLTQEMSNLEPGERMAYTVFVADPARFVYDQVDDLLTFSPGTNPFQFLTPQGWLDAGYQLTGHERQQVLAVEPDVADVITTKLNNMVYQCLLLIQIDAPTPERVFDLSRIDSQLQQYKNLPYGALAWYEETLLDHIRLVDTAEEAAQSDTVGLLDAWLTNRSKKWRNFRLLLDTQELAALWHLPNQTFTSSKIVWSRKRGPLPQKMQGQQAGVCLGHNRYGGREQPVYITDEDRQTHINILGMTGVGKSTLLHHLITQDIVKGHGVAVIDPHGKLVRAILQTSIPREREGDVIVLDLANEKHPPPLNPLRAAKGATAIGRITGVLERLYGSPQGAPRMANALSSALMTLEGESQATVWDVARLFLDDAYRHQVLSEVEDDVIWEFWEHEYEAASPGYQSQIREPVVYRMRTFYRNAYLRPVICHPDNLQFEALIEQGKIILLSLAMDEDHIPEQDRNLMGALVVSQLQMAAMKHPEAAQSFYLYIDEVQRFVTSTLDVVFSEARKFGLSLTVANQYLQQLAGDTLDAMMGNVGAMIVFQCGLRDAQQIAPYMRPAFDAGDLVNLDKYEAVVKMRHAGETQPAFSLSPLKPFTLETLSQEERSNALEKELRIRQLAVEQYTPKTRDEVMSWLTERYGRKHRGYGEPEFYDE